MANYYFPCQKQLKLTLKFIANQSRIYMRMCHVGSGNFCDQRTPKCQIVIEEEIEWRGRELLRLILVSHDLNIFNCFTASVPLLDRHSRLFAIKFNCIECQLAILNLTCMCVNNIFLLTLSHSSKWCNCKVSTTWTDVLMRNK